MVEPRLGRQATVVNVLTGMRRDILLGKYDQEEQISELELSEKYQVSRSSVRSALQMLERDGLLEVYANGRKRVKAVDKKYIEDLCKTRSLIECEAARIIISKEKIDFSRLLSIVGQLYLAVQMEDAKERGTLLTKLNDDFHDEIINLADNRALEQCHRTLAPMVTVINEINTSLEPNQNEHGHYAAHKKIAELLMARDESVIEYLRYHTFDAIIKDAWIAIRKLKGSQNAG